MLMKEKHGRITRGEAQRLTTQASALRVKQLELEARVAHYNMVIKWLWRQAWGKA